MAGPTNKQAQVREIMRCAKDPIHFINKWVKIQHPARGTIPFTTYDFQDNVIHDLMEHRYNIIVKSRQLGISTITAAYALWLALFYRDKNIVCIATKLKTAQNFIKKVKVAFNSLPGWIVLKPKVGDSKQHIAFANGSSVTALPRSADVGRSEAVSLLIIDEAAHIEGFEEIWDSILPTLSEGGSMCMLSSPLGAAGVFYKTWVDAVAGKNGFNPIELKWDVHPDRDEEWLEDQRRLFPPRKFAQEYMCDFLGSGDTYVSGQDIDWLKGIKKTPKSIDGDDRKVWIWEEPNPDHTYVMSADVARGDSGGDYSTFHIIDNNTSECVAEYMGHMRPDEFGKLLDKWGRKYNNALLAPELNTYGHHAITVLQHRDYPNFYYEQKVKNSHFIPGDDDLPGYNNQGKDKRERLLDNMEAMIRNRQIKIYSERFIHQLQGFVHTGRKSEARKGYHDDLIMSFAIAMRIMRAEGIDEGARLMAYAMLAGTNRRTDTYTGPGQGINPHSNEYVSAVFNRKTMKEESKDEKKHTPNASVSPAAEADFGAHLPEDVKRRLGGLNWLL